MRRSSTPIAHFHTSKLYQICIYVYFSSIKNHNGTLNLSRLDIENVNYEMILRIQEVLGPVYIYRKLDWLSQGSISKCDDFEFRKVKNYKLHEKMTLLIYLTHNDSNYHLLKFKIVAFRDQPSDDQFNFRCMLTGP